MSETLAEFGHLFPYYEIQSEESAVIFIHGLASDSAFAWSLNDESHSTPKQVVKRTNASVFCCDWPTDAFSRYWTLEDGAHHIVDSLRFAHPDLSKLKRLILVGHSMGGLVALDIVASLAHYIEHLGCPLEQVHLELLATPIHGSGYANLLSLLPDKIRPEYVEAIRTDSTKIDALVGTAREAVLHGVTVSERKVVVTGREIMEGTFFRSVLGKKLPRFIYDLFPPVVGARKLESIFPNPRRLPRADHRSITDFLVSGHILIPDLESVLARGPSSE